VADQKSEQKSDKGTGTTPDSTLVERWLHDQQQWQRTAMTYLDSMVKDDSFLVHLGNAMRGSLLAGKPYPTAATPDGSAGDRPADDRLDQVLFALRQMEGQLQDLRMTLDELRTGRKGGPSAATNRARAAAAPKKPVRAKSGRRKTAAPAKAPRATGGKRTPKRRVRG
jgi:hypothetical protein